MGLKWELRWSRKLMTDSSALYYMNNQLLLLLLLSSFWIKQQIKVDSKPTRFIKLVFFAWPVDQRHIILIKRKEKEQIHKLWCKTFSVPLTLTLNATSWMTQRAAFMLIPTLTSCNFSLFLFLTLCIPARFIKCDWTVSAAFCYLNNMQGPKTWT